MALSLGGLLTFSSFISAAFCDLHLSRLSESLIRFGSPFNGSWFRPAGAIRDRLPRDDFQQICDLQVRPPVSNSITLFQAQRLPRLIPAMFVLKFGADWAFSEFPTYVRPSVSATTSRRFDRRSLPFMLGYSGSARKTSSRNLSDMAELLTGFTQYGLADSR